jgi:NAD(P)-dependent dehydrogenase (short-subunit alcohol dehydrogenase family)
MRPTVPLLDRLLDASVLFSYDASGFRRHARRFVPGEADTPLGGGLYVVTGANRGLGRALAAALAARGATVALLCRDAAAGAAAAAAMGPGRAVCLPLDLTDRAAIAAAPAALAAAAPGLPLRGLVHNAAVLPTAPLRTADGRDGVIATHLDGPLRLTAALWPALRAADDARIVWISSGGALTQRLDPAALVPARFDGVQAYARTKRAQIVLARLLQARAGGPRLRVYAMHPGWADTPGVQTSLPRFHALLGRRLRSAEEGADTALWLLARRPAADPGFYLDRAPAAEHPLPGTAARPADEAALWTRCLAEAGLPEGAFDG